MAKILRMTLISGEPNFKTADTKEQTEAICDDYEAFQDHTRGRNNYARIDDRRDREDSNDDDSNDYGPQPLLRQSR